MDEKESTACKVNMRGVGVMFCRDFWRLPQRNDWELFLVTLLACYGAVFVFFKGYGRDACLPKQGEHRLQNFTDIEGRPKSFYDTDGTSGYNYDIVPDIIHLVRYNQPELTFIDVVCLRSMYLNHRPAKIYVHCDQCGFTGNYTRLVEGITFTFISTVFPKEVFGIKIENSHHSTDVARLRALLRYGGIYLDGDVFVVQSLRRFLRYEATVSCQEKGSFGNMIMIHHKNSRFLRLYMDTYRQGEAPSDPLYDIPLNESNIRDYDTALGQMARSVLFGTSDFVAPDAPILSVGELAARVDRGENITKMSPGHQRPFFQNVLKGEK
ncbi:hypothetical protein HPB50_006717 [Hyalomma asiaticum]|uniref:Uncharacterized protein n=1 Tax=Hyalomma asiaticum TaxID=266040 RepID=A0ACB7RNL2_HYAAI|nr:hypothetical protein HPB50_006717 [Hyalomma asiaticum]